MRDQGYRAEARRMKGCCLDCGRKYGDEFGFPDLVVPHEIWKIISPTGDEGGLLCPSCMCRRAADAGLENIEARFTSGPFSNPLPSSERERVRDEAWNAGREAAAKAAEDYADLALRIRDLTP